MVLRVALANADELVVRGLASMLRGQGESVQLVDLASSEGVDIMLYDAYSSSRAHDRLARLCDDPRFRKVVVYTWNFQPWLAAECIQQGASGYISKSLPAAELVEALHGVHAGRVLVAPDRKDTRSGGAWPGQEDGLTAREAEVLSLITAGLSNADAAARMGVSLNSVKSYIRSCYRKIGADSRSQAVLWGVAHGLGAGRVEPSRTMP